MRTMQIHKLDAWNTVPTTMQRVAIYARVSSEKDAAMDSIENQVQSFKEQIDITPEWNLVGIYVDKGVSGTVVARPEFQRMLQDCRDGKIDVILTKSFTRFARNTLVLLETLRELKALGINVIFEKDNIRSLDETGELLITLLASFAQEESRSASENQNWRIKKLFEEGKPTSGRMLGYRLIDGELSIIPEEAEIVRNIFNLYLSGMGKVGIAKEMERIGHGTMNGRGWCPSSIYHILTNEKYCGELLLQKTYRPDYITKKQIVNRGERRMYHVANSHEPIISKEVFDAVQAEMHRRAEINKPKRHRVGEKYLFTGLIQCGKCGKNYCHKLTACGTKYEKAVWICLTFNTRGKDACNNQQIPEDILIAKTSEVLGTKDLATAIPEMLKGIRVPGPGRLIFVFKDGIEKEVEWANHSRRESWTPEMREKARKTALRYSECRKEAQECRKR